MIEAAHIHVDSMATNNTSTYTQINNSKLPVICKIPSFLSQLWGCLKGRKVVWYKFMGMFNVADETHLLQ